MGNSFNDIFSISLSMIRKRKVPSWHQARSSLQGPNKMATSCSKSQVTPALDGWKVQVQVENSSLLTGDWLRRNQPRSILLLSPAWLTSLSTEHLHCPKPDGEFSKSASCSIVVWAPGTLALGRKCISFFIGLLSYFFLLDDTLDIIYILDINSSWRHLGEWQDNLKKIWGRG